MASCTTVGKYHRFLKKTKATAGQYRGTHAVFLQNTKNSQYAWNSAPIDGTDIIRSFAAVVWELHFLVEVKLLQTPTNLNQGNYGLYEYLWHVSNNSQFATSILQILIKERQTAHREQWNQNQSAPEFKVDGAVEAHVQVKPKLYPGGVTKHAYRAWLPFQIKMFLETIPMWSSAIIIQHMV